jgi:hypothetical protein
MCEDAIFDFLMLFVVVGVFYASIFNRLCFLFCVWFGLRLVVVEGLHQAALVAIS